MKIYTKTGDEGMTTLKGKRVPKYDCSIDGQGEIDELNCWIGAVRSECGGYITLEKIQLRLMDMGAQLATEEIRLNQGHIEELEEKIDTMEAWLPPLENFILPFSSSTIHIARAVCRRAERVVAAWRAEYKGDDKKFEFVIPYLNRLSDYLFVFARYQSEHERVWKGDN